MTCKCGMQFHCLRNDVQHGQYPCMRSADGDDGLCATCRKNIADTGGYQLEEIADADQESG